jgi:hypothetical protein
MKISELLQESTLIQEIEKYRADDYTGGKSQLKYSKPPKKLYPLPGNSGLLYSIVNTYYGSRYASSIKLWDPNNPRPTSKSKPSKNRYELWYEYYERLEKWEKAQEKLKKQSKLTEPTPVGELNISRAIFPIDNAVKVESITVDEDYRGMGLAKSLYGIVLTIMKKTLLAGDEQTPGGRRNWASLSQIPGVQVYGYVAIENDELDRYTNEIMGKLGGDYMGETGNYHYFRFNVRPNTTGKELESYVKSKKIKLYGDSWNSAVGGLYAIWTGR